MAVIPMPQRPSGHDQHRDQNEQRSYAYALGAMEEAVNGLKGDIKNIENNQGEIWQAINETRNAVNKVNERLAVGHGIALSIKGLFLVLGAAIGGLLHWAFSTVLGKLKP